MADAYTTVAMAAGLAGVTGIRAGLPLFAVALVKHFQSPAMSAAAPALVILAAIAILESLFDKLPQGRLTELSMPPLRALTGGIVFAWYAASVPLLLGLLAGVFLSLGVGLSKSSWRGLAAFVLGPYIEGLASSLEDAAAGFLAVLCVFVPVLGLAVVLGLSTRSFARFLAERRVWLG